MIEDDEIMEEWDIYVNTELTPFLHLAPLPSPTLSDRFNFNESTGSLQARFKPTSRLLEVILPLDDLSTGNLVPERVKDLQLGRGQKLSGSGWQWNRVQYLLGQFTTDNELHLTPVESVIPLTGSLTHLDEYDARMKLATSPASLNSSGTASRRSHEDVAVPSSSSSAAATTTSAKAIQVQFRKKETDEQVQARLNSFSHLQRQVDDEPWISLKHYNPKAPEVAAVRDKLIGTCRDPLEFLPNEDYLQKVINFSNFKSPVNQ